jgi:hypothetical protein
MSAIFLGIAYVLSLLSFLVCDIIFLILNKDKEIYLRGFGITGTVIFVFAIFFGIFILGAYHDHVNGIFHIVYGILGIIIQVTIGLALKLSFYDYFFIPIIICSCLVVLSIFVIIFRYCCCDK